MSKIPLILVRSLMKSIIRNGAFVPAHIFKKTDNGEWYLAIQIPLSFLWSISVPLILCMRLVCYEHWRPLCRFSWGCLLAQKCPCLHRGWTTNILNQNMREHCLFIFNKDIKKKFPYSTTLKLNAMLYSWYYWTSSILVNSWHNPGLHIW